jgi:hypothetical protein
MSGIGGASLGGAPFDGSSSAASSTGAVQLGGFTFAPKGSTLPAAAWVALAVVAAVLVLKSWKG